MADKVPFARVEEAPPGSGGARALSCSRCAYELNALTPLPDPPPRVRCPECGLEQRTDGSAPSSLSRFKIFAIFVGAWVASCLMCIVVPLPITPAIASFIIAIYLALWIKTPHLPRRRLNTIIALLWLSSNLLLYGILAILWWVVIGSGAIHV